MKHERHWTLEQANASIDFVGDLIAKMRGAREQLGDEEARKALSDAAPGNGGGAPGVVVSEAFLTLRDSLAELQALGVVLRDLDRGLVDYPSLRNGEEIYLCWEEGESEIGFWHDTESGYGGRQPL